MSRNVNMTKDTLSLPPGQEKKKLLENPGIDPGTSHMLSERSTTWASPPYLEMVKLNTNIFLFVFTDCNLDFAY